MNKEEKINLNDEIRKKYKYFFLTCDIMILCCVFMNFAALFITNYMVMAKEPNTELLEANPVIAEMDNYETNIEVQTKYWQLARHFIIWLGILLGLIYLRLHAYNRWGVAFYFAIVFFLFYTIGADFFNNFGFFVGKLACS